VSKKKTVRRGREYWAGLVGEFESAGLSQSAFCERHEVRESAFRYWLYLLRNEGRGKPKSTGRFVQVVPSKATNGSACRLQLGSVELTFSELPPAGYVGDLLRLMDR